MGFFFFKNKGKEKIEVKGAPAFPIVVLLVETGENSKVYELPSGRDFHIGRDPNNDLCLNDPKVSPFHAKISPVKSSYVLYDLSSETGVKVNCKEIHQCRLRFGDRIMIGSVSLFFDLKEGYRKSEEEFFEGMEKRKAVRISPPLTLRFIVYSANKSKEFVALVKDISLEGVRIEIEEELLKGSMIEAQMYSKELAPIDIIGTIVRKVNIDKGGKILTEVGIQFLEMSEESRQKLHDYLVKCIS